MNVPDEIKPYPGNEQLDELYQKTGIRYTFLSPPRADNTLCSPFMKCKDYLADMVRAQVTNTKSVIYGLNYVAGTSPAVDLRRYRLVIKEQGKNCYQLLNSLMKGISFIQQAEKIAGVKGRTSYGVYSAENAEYVLLNAPAFWLKSPVLTSLFPLLLRLGTHELLANVPYPELETAFDLFDTEDGKKFTDKDAGFARTLKDKVVVLLKHWQDLLKIDSKTGYDPTIFDSTTIHDYHEYAGVISFLGSTGLYNTEANRAKLGKLVVAYEAEKKAKAAESSVLWGTTISQNPYYRPTDISFGFLTPVENSKDYKTVGRSAGATGVLNTCREFMNDVVAQSIKAGRLPKDKLRLLLWCSGTEFSTNRQDEFNALIIKAKQAINLLEKEYGLKRSILKRIRINGIRGTNTHQWVLIGSPVWLTSPITMNIYITLIRSFVKHLFKGNQFPDKLSYATLKSDVAPSIQANRSWVKPYEKDIWNDFERVDKLMHSWKKYFKTTDVSQHYCFDDPHFSENYTKLGISSLFAGKSPDKVLTEKLKIVPVEA